MLVLEKRLLRASRYRRGCVTIAGRTLTFDHPLSFLSAYRRIFHEGSHNHDRASVIGVPRTLDCGANVGLATLQSGEGGPQILAEFLQVLEDVGPRLQVNNAVSWVNPLVTEARVGRCDQLLLVYGRRAAP